MSQAAVFKCPSCGAYLEYQPGQKSLKCPYCSSVMDEKQLLSMSQKEETEASSSGLRGYHCENCGAEIVTGETTAATRCYFCHSPVVLADRLSDSFKPDGVIPFKVSRDEAEKKFDAYIRKHHFVEKGFFSKEQRSYFNGVYYPYWIGDVEGEGSFTGEGTIVSHQTTAREQITITNHFAVEREGKLSFHDMVRKALHAADRQLADGVHPYSLKEIQPFAMGYLTGFLAEMRDVPESDVKTELEEEARSLTPAMMRENHHFATLTGQASFRAVSTHLRYVLLPTWVLTYQKQGGKPYYFMMNGQNGKVCGRLPLDRVKLLLVSGLVGLAVGGALSLGGAMLW